VTSYDNSSKQELYSGQESQYGRTYWHRTVSVATIVKHALMYLI